MRHHQRRQGAWSGGGPDFAGQSCVERAGLMDLLRWRHVDMPRAASPSQSPSQSQSLEAESDPLGNFVLIVLWVAGAQT